MKKTLIISNVFWVLLFSAFIFKNCTPEKTAERCDDISKSYEKESFVGFPSETAYEMAQNYKGGAYQLASKRLGSEDARSVWFSLDSLKKFIWNVEKATCETGSGKLSDLGIRIYFAEYPSVAKMKELGGLRDLKEEEAKNLAGRHTLFIVPTLRDAKGNTDYDAMRTWRIKKERESGKARSAAMFLAPPPEPPFESVLNHATLCPVACSGEQSF